MRRLQENTQPLSRARLEDGPTLGRTSPQEPKSPQTSGARSNPCKRTHPQSSARSACSTTRQASRSPASPSTTSTDSAATPCGPSSPQPRHLLQQETGQHHLPHRWHRRNRALRRHLYRNRHPPRRRRQRAPHHAQPTPRA